MAERITNRFMTAMNTSPTVFRADQEHSGIRTAVMVLLLVTIIVLYMGIRAVWSALSPDGLPDFSFLINCTLSLVLGLAIVYGIEQLLKLYWPSGRALIVDDATIQTQSKIEESVVIKWAHQPYNQSWWFNLKGFQRGGRERRVPKDWVCVATQLQEADKRIIAYAYLPQKKAARYTEDNRRFHQIYPAEVYKSGFRSRVNLPSRPEIPSAVLAGKDGKYWQAERNRWVYGYELSAKDFEKFMNIVESQAS